MSCTLVSSTTNKNDFSITHFVIRQVYSSFRRFVQSIIIILLNYNFLVGWERNRARIVHI